MGVRLSTMSIKLRAESDRLRSDVRQAKNTLRDLNGTVGQTGVAAAGTQGGLLAMAGKLKGVAAAAAAAAAAYGAFAAARFAIRSAADAESAEVAMTNLVGSAEKARSILAEVTEFSARTPFQLPELVRTTNKLLAFGFSADEVVSQLKLLADISAGSGANIFELATTFGQARAEGVALTRDLRELTNRAVPILDTLKQQVGLTGEEFQKFVEGRGIDFATLERALRSLASEGGSFANATAKQAQTLNGLFSTLKDQVSLLARELGQILAPLLKTLVRILIDVVQATRDFLKTIGLVRKEAKPLAKAVEEPVKAVKTVSDEAKAAAEAAAKEMERLKSRAADVFASTRTPFENAQKQVAELQELYRKQLITLDTYRRAVQSIADDLERANDARSELTKPVAIGIQTRRSGAFSAAQEQKRNLQFLADKKKEELELAKKRNELLEQVGIKLDMLAANQGQQVNLKAVRF